MVEVFEDKDEAWDLINKNVGQVINVNPDGCNGHHAFIESCNYLKRSQSPVDQSH